MEYEPDEEREPDDERMATPEKAERWWKGFERRDPTQPRVIFFAFETANHLRAERLAIYLRETNEYPIEIKDRTKIGDAQDRWWVTGTTPKQVMNQEYIETLFRWLSSTELRLGERLTALSGG